MLHLKNGVLIEERKYDLFVATETWHHKDDASLKHASGPAYSISEHCCESGRGGPREASQSSIVHITARQFHYPALQLLNIFVFVSAWGGVLLLCLRYTGQGLSDRRVYFMKS